jgi:hypothetical protein
MSDFLSEYLKCPISKQYFYDPVIAEDGNTYERKNIETWLKSKNTSPLTRKIIKKPLVDNLIIKQLVAIHLTNNPNEKKNQYLPTRIENTNGEIVDMLSYTGFGIFYDNDVVVYNGEWFNGQRHGKGIYYYNNIKKYNVKWLNYKKYNGEWLNDKKSGKGIEYYENGNVKYNGDWLNDNYHGKGITYDHFFEKIKYNGDWLNNKKSGKGIEYFQFIGKIKYNGDWFNDNYHGKGIKYYENENIKYNGEFLNGDYNGKGIEYYENGNIKYDGEFLNGDYHNENIMGLEDYKSIFYKLFAKN